MLRSSMLLLLLLCVEEALSQDSDAGYSYGSLPSRPPRPGKTSPPTVRPITHRPRRPSLPSQGGSRYLRRRKPGKKNLDKSILMQLMGDDYQSSWMSDEKPQKPMLSLPSPDLDRMPGRWAHERLLEQLDELNLTAEFRTLQPELMAVEELVKSWLVKRSACPVEFTWKDLGPTFWPRWVREGACLDRKGSCSFPTGMHCVPAATTTVHILRWQCRDRKMTIFKKSADGEEEKRKGGKTPEDGLHRKRDRLAKTADAATDRRRVAEFSRHQQRRKKRCDWYRVPYPITIDCFCTC